MVHREVEETDVIKLGGEGTHMAKVLLRNWVAWVYFVESMPKRRFNVRLPAGHKV